MNWKENLTFSQQGQRPINHHDLNKFGRAGIPMLPTKTQSDPFFASGEEDIWKVFTIYARGGNLEWLITFLKIESSGFYF